MKQNIFFDLDDTLVYCNKYFHLVIEQFNDSMLTWFKGYPEVTERAVKDKQTEIDIAGVQVLGFKSDHFPQSFIDTYTYFSDITGRSRSAVEENFLWKLGRSVYEHTVEPYPFMEETLSDLAEAGHTLHLYTGGELLIQRRKIEELHLERYFDSRIYIRRHKNNEALESILLDNDLDREHTWMIGNSIRTDVVPALTAGIHAIHMKVDTEWAFNNVEIAVQPRGAFLTLQHLPDVPPAIYRYMEQRQ